MPRKIKYDQTAYEFLMDLNAVAGSGYASVVRKIHAIAKNPAIRGSVHVDYEFEIIRVDGKETLLFTQCRYVEVMDFTIVYTWSDKDEDIVVITRICDHK